MAFHPHHPARAGAWALLAAAAIAATPAPAQDRAPPPEDRPRPALERSEPSASDGGLRDLRLDTRDRSLAQRRGSTLQPLAEAAAREALESEARSEDRDGTDDDDARPAPRPRTPSVDIFAEPERPASALASPSAGARPAAPETAAAPNETGVTTDAGLDAADTALDAPADGTATPGGRRLDGLRTATGGPARAAARTRPFGRVEDARPDLFGTLRTQPESLRDPLPNLDPDDPFSALGIRGGRLILYPQLLQSIGATSNVDLRPGAGSGAFSETTVSARLLSTWSRHGAEINASGTYRRNFDGEVRDDPRVSADARLRFDLGNRLSATVRGAVSYARDEAPTGEFEGLTGERPETFDSSLATDLEQAIGRAALRATVSLARSERTSVLAGVPDETYGTLTGALRASYELSPALQPFAEASLGRRTIETPAPADGAKAPDSTLSAMRGGVAFRFSEKLHGEAALGYGRTSPDREGSATVSAPTLDAVVNWSPRRGTEVALGALTRFEPGDGGLSADTVYETSLGLKHRWRARTDLSALGTVRLTDAGTAGEDETLYAFETGVTYWLSRAAALTALYRHEALRAERTGRDYDADTLRLGLRLQR